MSSRKSKWKRKLRYKCRHFGFVINIICLLCVATYVFAHNDAETSANTITTYATIHDVQGFYKYGINSRRSGMITFSTDDCKYVCRTYVPFFSSPEEILQNKLSMFETAEKNGIVVTITSTDEKIDIFDSMLSDKKWAVGVYTDDLVLCSIEEHNEDQLKGKIVDLILISIWLLLSILYIYLMHFLEPNRRRKKKH